MGNPSWSLFFSCCTALVLITAGRTDLETREIEIVERYLQLYRKNATFAREYDREFPIHSEQLNQSFPCVPHDPSPSVPTSVHALRPGDIKVIGAIGDSLTAGRGVEGGILGLLFDYRGKSWSAGGDDDYSKMITVPNILKLYNPNIYGFSQGTGEKKARFNVAVTGAKSAEALGQAQELVKRMKEDPNVDFDNDWKLITIFIGANDLCDFCMDRQKFSVEQYGRNIEDALDYLHANVPRAFVNLVEVLNVQIVRELAANLVCEAIHFFACDCAANPKNKEEEEELILLKDGYQEVARALASSGRYDTRDDFTVVLQPFFRETYTPKTESGKADQSFFASDCFHFSKRGQQAAAEALWNNLVEPVGSKRKSWTPGEVVECPSEEFPYLFTAKNSKGRQHPHFPSHPQTKRH